MPEKVNHTDVVYIRCPDGTGVGTTEGRAEGIGEGGTDGKAEGIGEGGTEGLTVGDGVGLALGIAVIGIRVGAVDGAAVGASDIANTPNS